VAMTRVDRLIRGGRRHWLFIALLVFGVLFRAAVSVAYHPALIRRDAVGYLANSQNLEPSEFHPIVYPLLLRLLPVDRSLASVSILQHVLIVAVAIALYLLLSRLGVPSWLGALATAPVLLDPYQLNIEQYVLSEPLFMLLLVAGCAALLWRRPPGFAAAALAGVLFAAAALTRTVGLAVVVPAALAALALSAPLPLRTRFARAGVLAAAFGIAVAGYAAWFHTHHGSYAITTYGGRYLYGRVVEITDCRRLSLPAYERPLCPFARGAPRPNANQLMWSLKFSPFITLRVPPGKTKNDVAADFAERVIRDRPLAYLRIVGEDVLHSFAPVKTTGYDDVPVGRWYFPRGYRVPAPGHRWAGRETVGFPDEYASAYAYSNLATWVRTYQRFVYTPGTVLGVCLLIGLVAALGVGRARRSDLRAPAFTFSAIGLSLVLASSLTTIFSWRYQLPQLVLLPPAAALGVTALFFTPRTPGRRSSA
jgi:hypothetical protein